MIYFGFIETYFFGGTWYEGIEEPTRQVGLQCIEYSVIVILFLPRNINWLFKVFLTSSLFSCCLVRGTTERSLVVSSTLEEKGKINDYNQ